MLKLQKQQSFFGYHYKGRTFDCGSPEGFVEANVAFSLWRKDFNPRMMRMISDLLEEHTAGEAKARIG